ncbi:hypothetical protein PVAND_016219 [Polypedilum vanderplanki]|uniref:Uncharacterized protein n=1 Tax=Polypedilum vanderplanki TaxID=319348 RepID=A0A9J6BF76_POLVA|nr:hypothetical protein PVAND_016219 [Polypedilum vanderplanki]
MLRAALKILAYLSILTSTRTSSSYLEPQSLVSFRRSALSDEMQQQPQQPPPDTYEWRGAIASFYMPRLLNSEQQQQLISSSNNNKNLISKSSLNNNNRRANKKSRKSKKQEQSRSMSKQLYENHSKRLDTNVDVANSNSSTNLTNNEYPTTQVDAKQERELQELFGVEGARKYQEYQLQQRILSKTMGNDGGGENENEDMMIGQEVKEQQKKRDGSGGLGAAEEMQDVSGAMINQMMSRTTRRQREYDVPLIQCPPATDGMERFACPTPDRQGRYRCIDDHVLCDGFIDCPEGADEDRQACMFYKTTKAHLDVLADALLRWARGR